MKNKIITIAIIIILCVMIGGFIYMQQQSNTETIQVGDTVSITYQASLPDGRMLIDNTTQATTIIIGESNIPGLDTILIGSKSGDIITKTLEPDQTYGQFYDPNNIQKVAPYTLTQAGITPKENTFIIFGSNRYYIQKIQENEVWLDANPEHTRQNIEYTVHIHQLYKKQ